MRYSVSIVIPSYGRPEILDRCVNRLKSQEYRSYEIIIVHQGTPHPEYNDKNIDVICLDEPIGSTKAKNKAIEASHGDILVFIDDDMIPESNRWISEFVEAFQNKDENVGAIGGFIDESLPYFSRRGETGTITTNKLGFYRIISRFNIDESKQVDHLKVGNTAIRAKVLEDLNKPYFDPVYGGNSFREETDFFLRVRKAGYSLMYTPKCAANHLQAEDGGQYLAVRGSLRRAWWHGRNEAVLFRRHFYSGPASIIKFLFQEILYKPRIPHLHVSKIIGIFVGLRLSETEKHIQLY